jgi:hypothetical protein
MLTLFIVRIFGTVLIQYSNVPSLKIKINDIL